MEHCLGAGKKQFVMAENDRRVFKPVFFGMQSIRKSCWLMAASASPLATMSNTGLVIRRRKEGDVQSEALAQSGKGLLLDRTLQNERPVLPSRSSIERIPLPLRA